MRERAIIFSGPMIRALIAGRKTQTRRIVKPAPPSVEEVRAKAGIDFNLSDSGDAGVWRVMGPVWAVRDLMSGNPVDAKCHADVGPQWRCPYGVAGDRLWVKEAWSPASREHHSIADYPADSRPRDADNWWAWYAASDDVDESNGKSPWRSPIFMPRWASRITLEIAEVRVQRMKDTSKEDAIAEGARHFPDLPSLHPYKNDARWSMEEPTSVHDCLYSPQSAFADYVNKLHAKPRERDIWDVNPWVWAISFKRVP